MPARRPRPRPSSAPASSWRDRLWLLLWGAPLWAAVFGRVLKHKTPWMADYNSVACGAERARAGLPLYAQGAACPHLAMSTYVYPPWVAQAFSAPLGVLGERGMLAAYAVVFAVSLVLLLWTSFWRPLPFATRPQRAPFLAFVSANPFVVGNIAVVAQAAIVAAAVWIGADSVALLAAVVVASLVKPIYLTFLLIPAYAAAAPLRRLALVAAGVGITAALVLSSLPGMAEWRAFVVGVAVDPDPGGGFLRWAGDLGVRDHLALAAAYGVYALLLAAAGLAIAERGGLDRAGRTWLAISVAVLLLPRLVAYDLLVLGPGFAAAAQAARTISERVARRLRGLWIAACLIYLVSSVVGGPAKIGHSVSLWLLVAGLLHLGARLAPRIRRRSALTSAPDIR